MSTDRGAEVPMKSSEFIHTASDGTSIFVRRWLPSGTPRAALLVVHGLAEHSHRYERLAALLTQGGVAIYAPDLRGHGRTADGKDLGWFAERDGFPRVRDDLHEVAKVAVAENPGVPLFLLGHSMGSLLAESYLPAYGRELSGCILSGVLAPLPLPMMIAGRLIISLGSIFKGQRKPARFLDRMSFRSNNRDFEPARTSSDWLSRDSAEVDKYVADPLCGFVASFGMYRDMFSGFVSVYLGRTAFFGLPKALPLFIVAGAEDPLGGAQGFVPLLADKFKAAGVLDIETRLYPGARHEVLNETNRDEVMGDIKTWLEGRLAKLKAESSV
jgi:alpha-beta hydrolase superfamily lysophospholipase